MTNNPSVKINCPDCDIDVFTNVPDLIKKCFEHTTKEENEELRKRFPNFKK